MDKPIILYGVPLEEIELPPSGPVVYKMRDVHHAYKRAVMRGDITGPDAARYKPPSQWAKKNSHSVDVKLHYVDNSVWGDAGAVQEYAEWLSPIMYAAWMEAYTAPTPAPVVETEAYIAPPPTPAGNDQLSEAQLFAARRIGELEIEKFRLLSKYYGVDQ